MIDEDFLIEIISPRGNKLRIPKWQSEYRPRHTEYTTDRRCEAIKAWMEQERMATDE